MNPKPTNRRLVGRWVLNPSNALYPPNYIIAIWNDGTVELFDSLSCSITRRPESEPWRLWFKFFEAMDALPECAEMRCRYSYRLVLPKRLVQQILRANDQGIITFHRTDGPGIAAIIGDGLERALTHVRERLIFLTPKWYPGAPEISHPSEDQDVEFNFARQRGRPPRT